MQFRQKEWAWVANAILPRCKVTVYKVVLEACMLDSIVFITEDEILIYSFGRNHAADGSALLT